MIVAITGGTGFIGRKLALRHLAKGDEVRLLSRRAPSDSGLPDSIVWWRGDLENLSSIESFVEGVDVLYHCAGVIRNTERMEAVHVEGTRMLIDVAKGNVERWVQLSSVGAYGPQREGVITEKSKLNPNGIYEVTKVKSDMLVIDAASRGAFDYVILRPSNVYGAEMTNRSLFSLIAMVQRGLFFFVGSPGASANYIHVDNVVEALLLCGSDPNAIGHIYNLSDHCPMEEFISFIAKGLKRSVPNMRLPEVLVRFLANLVGRFPGVPLSKQRIDALTNRSMYSTNKIEHELGYNHLVSIEEGFLELVDFWKQKQC